MFYWHNILLNLNYVILNNWQELPNFSLSLFFKRYEPHIHQRFYFHTLFLTFLRSTLSQFSLHLHKNTRPWPKNDTITAPGGANHTEISGISDRILNKIAKTGLRPSHCCDVFAILLIYAFCNFSISIHEYSVWILHNMLDISTTYTTSQAIPRNS